MDNPEKLAIQRTQDEDKQNKNTTPLYTQTKTHNVNRTQALLQTTGNREEPNIVDKHHFLYK